MLHHGHILTKSLQGADQVLKTVGGHAKVIQFHVQTLGFLLMTAHFPQNLPAQCGHVLIFRHHVMDIQGGFLDALAGLIRQFPCFHRFGMIKGFSAHEIIGKPENFLQQQGQFFGFFPRHSAQRHRPTPCNRHWGCRDGGCGGVGQGAFGLFLNFLINMNQQGLNGAGQHTDFIMTGVAGDFGTFAG